MQRFLTTPLDQLLAHNNSGQTAPAAALERAWQLVDIASAGAPAYRQFLLDQQQQEQQQQHQAGTQDPPPQRLHAATAAAAAAAGAASWLGRPLPPLVTKPNYIHKYPLTQRCLGASLAGCFVHSSSGSSGTPTMWARGVDDEAEVAARFEQVFHDSFLAHKSRCTAAIICFPLGTWVGGLFTTLCTRYLTMKGYPLVIATPGSVPGDALAAVRQLSPLADQTILLGYPPAVKGLIDEGLASGLHWGAFNLGLILAGEVFSEEWRQLVGSRAGITDAATRIVSIFGTADAGVIAQETPLSARIRAWLAAHPDTARKLFGRDRLPTLAQYDPCARLLELNPEDGTLVVSALPSGGGGGGGAAGGGAHATGSAGCDGRPSSSSGDGEPGPGTGSNPALLAGSCGAVPGSTVPDGTAPGGTVPGGTVLAGLRRHGAPLIRYCIGDAGGLMDFDDMLTWLGEHGCEVSQSQPPEAHPVRRQPFVWVFGRSFWAVSLYGANVWVENVMAGLEAPPLPSFTTGKFVLYVQTDTDLNARLGLRVELARHIQAEGEERQALARSVASAVLGALLRLNSEYRSFVPQGVQAPLVSLHDFGDPDWFPVGVKHSYIR